MYRNFLLVAAISMAAAGCAAPMVTPNPVTFQSKIEHANDWQRLADRSAARFASTLHTDPPKVFVAPGPADMPFASAYKRYLEQALTQRGYPVAQSAVGAVILNFDVQTFLLSSDSRKFPVDYGTFWTSLVSGGAQFRNVSSIDTGAFILLGLGGIADYLAAIGDNTNAEVVITLSVVGSDRAHYLDSETVYVEAGDLPFYWSRTPSQSPQMMTADQTGLNSVNLPVRAGY